MATRRIPFALPNVGLAVLLGFLGTSRLAAEAPDLGKYVPSGVHFHGRWVSTEDSKSFEKPFFDAFDRLVKSGIGKDIFELATLKLDDDERGKIRETVKHVLELLATPRWAELVKKEVSFSFRISMPIPEYLWLCRVPEESAESHQAELRQVLEGIAGFAPQVISVSNSTRGEARISRLGSEDFPFGLSVFSKRDVVAITTSDALLEGVLGLMDSEDASGSVARDERFIASQRGLQEGTYGRAFFDLRGYLGFFRGMLGMAAGAAQGDPNASAALSVAGTVIDELARMEVISSAERIDGKHYFLDGRMTLSQENGPGFIERLLSDQKPLENFARIVPKDARGFYMTSGIDLETVHDGIVELIRDRFPEGEKMIEVWHHIQRTIGIDLKEDLFSWLDGGFGCISLPPRSSSTSPESIAYLRLKENEGARSVIRGFLGRVKSYVESRGQKMEFVGIPGLEDFKEVRIEALPWFRPVIGLPSGVLVVASSANAVERVAATFREEAPNISENPRFAVLRLPDAPLSEVYYQDAEGSLQGLSNLISAVGFFASLVPEERDTKPLIKVGAILTKLGRFVRDIDLVSSYAGWSRYDGERHEIRMRQVTTFRDPGASD